MAWAYLYVLLFNFVSAATIAEDDQPATIPAPVGSDIVIDPDVEQVKEPKYLVGLLRNSLSEEEPPQEGARVLQMTAASGQRFRCVIPNPNLPPLSQPRSPAQRTADVQGKLKTAFGNGCFTRPKDFWTYDVCPFDKIRQFHRESDQVTMEFSLGIHDHTRDELLANGTYIQRFTNGENGRQSLVRFVCNNTPDPKPLLVSVHEPQPHHYEFEIRTHLACLAKDGVEESVNDLLEALDGDCVFLNTGWWTYKFCSGRGVTQFHREQVPARSESGEAGAAAPESVVTAEFDLGRAPRDASPAFEIVRGASPEDTYAAAWYEDGTPCDIGDRRPRRTQLRVFCDPDESFALRAIKETASCEYQLIVATRRLCDHAAFAPEKPKVNEIVCAPTTNAVGALS